MTCREAAGRLGALADGNLDDAALRAHVEACADCARVVRDVTSMRAALRRVTLPPAPEGLLRPPAIAWPRWAAAAAVLVAALAAWAVFSSPAVPAPIASAAARFDAGPAHAVASIAEARAHFHDAPGFPDMQETCPVEGCADAAAGALPPMVFYRAGDKRIGLISSREPFPDMPDVVVVDGMKCVVRRVGDKTVMICGGEFGYHIWVANMTADELSALAHRFPRGAPTPEALRFVVSPMG